MSAPETKKLLRCAIYTRVSSDAGLEQDYTSLDAQREAAEAYIKSQAHEGWRLVRGQYNDGGFSGGSMERPGLQMLLGDIRARRIDIVVVYKVDRLTRSLADFAKLVELFDAQSVSFVSVTQSFNTTSSMGRLTLNVLLSFAQFEREVTGERIRDKIAASKQKGLWMGGVVPLGYRVEDRKLLVEEQEAQTIRLIFERYRDLRSLPALQKDLRDRCIVSRKRTLSSGKVVGGTHLTNGPLAAILRNRVYLGEINHRQNSYPGEHLPIVDQGLFEEVQSILNANRQGTRDRRDATNMLLMGKIFDDRGNRMSPAYAIKKGVRYRYYTSCVLAQGRREDAGTIARVSAMQIEQIVLEGLRQARGKSARHTTVATGMDIVAGVERVVVHPRTIDVVTATHFAADHTDSTEPHIIRIAWPGPVANPRREVIRPEGATSPSPKPMRSQPRTKLIIAIATARHWLAEVLKGDATLDIIAEREKCSERHIRSMLSLACLAPDIVKAAVSGHLPQGLGMTRLADLPTDWSEQRRQIGL